VADNLGKKRGTLWSKGKGGTYRGGGLSYTFRKGERKCPLICAARLEGKRNAPLRGRPESSWPSELPLQDRIGENQGKNVFEIPRLEKRAFNHTS